MIYILYSWMGFQQASWWFPIASADNMGQARAVKRKWPKWHTPMVASKPMGTINMQNWWKTKVQIGTQANLKDLKSLGLKSYDHHNGSLF